MLGAGGPPQQIQVPARGGANPSPKSDGDWETDLRNALSALRTLAADAQDHQEAATVDTCIANLQKLLATRQAGAESALGVTPAHKAMSRGAY